MAGVKLLSVKAKKNVLILTDGSEGTVTMAAQIAAVLKGNKVSVKTASEFRGNDLLPADAFFLGCEKSGPDSFAYLADLLKHINLAGRPCGVFSPGSEKTARYLAALLRDSEAALNPSLFFAGSGAAVDDWAQNVISKSF